MEYQFLDNKLNIDLTNLIASYAGPKSKQHIKTINNYNNSILDKFNNEEKLSEILNCIATIRYESRYPNLEFHDAEVDALNIFENIQDDLMIYYFQFDIFKRRRCEERKIFYTKIKDYIISYD